MAERTAADDCEADGYPRAAVLWSDVGCAEGGQHGGRTGSVACALRRSAESNDGQNCRRRLRGRLEGRTTSAAYELRKLAGSITVHVRKCAKNRTRLFSTPPLVKFTQNIDMCVNGGHVSHQHTRPENKTENGGFRQQWVRYEWFRHVTWRHIWCTGNWHDLTHICLLEKSYEFITVSCRITIYFHASVWQNTDGKKNERKHWQWCNTHKKTQKSIRQCV